MHVVLLKKMEAVPGCGGASQSFTVPLSDMMINAFDHICIARCTNHILRSEPGSLPKVFKLSTQVLITFMDKPISSNQVLLYQLFISDSEGKMLCKVHHKAWDKLGWERK